MLTLEGPSVARQFEQVGLRVCVFNFHRSKVGVLITLVRSKDYRSVLVEQNGVVASYQPRTAAGDHQHLVWVSNRTFCHVLLRLLIYIYMCR